jgi:hypothetical protein
MKPIHHRRRVFCPKHNAVNIRRGKRYIPDLTGIHWIAHQNVSLANPVEKPIAVKGGNVCPATATDDHFVFLK